MMNKSLPWMASDVWTLQALYPDRQESICQHHIRAISLPVNWSWFECDKFRRMKTAAKYLLQIQDISVTTPTTLQAIISAFLLPYIYFFMKTIGWFGDMMNLPGELIKNLINQYKLDREY